METKKGIFIFSLDTELAWGTRGEEKFLADYHNTRETVKKLLQLLQKYNIKATWAFVGHLFLNECKPVGGIKHPEIKMPESVRADWFSIDPATNESHDPVWYGTDLLNMVRGCNVEQEIGCHTFSHIPVTDDICTDEWFDSELKVCRELAEKQGIKLNSFVFPKNLVGRLSVLKNNGFICFRGVDKNWYRNLSVRLKKLAHVIDDYFALPVKSVTLSVQAGLVEIPGSYFYVHGRGWAKYLPASFRVRKSLTGIHKAIKEKQVFHLWTHPFNLASDPDALLGGLEKIFMEVDRMRQNGLVENLTMAETANNFLKV